MLLKDQYRGREEVYFKLLSWVDRGSYIFYKLKAEDSAEEEDRGEDVKIISKEGLYHSEEEEDSCLGDTLYILYII